MNVIPPINPDNPPKTNCNFTSLTLIFSNFIDNELGDEMSQQVVGAFVDTLRDRIEKVRHVDAEVKEFVKEEKKKKRTRIADSDLTEFMS